VDNRAARDPAACLSQPRSNLLLAMKFRPVFGAGARLVPVVC
jgi:hypothetical protein